LRDDRKKAILRRLEGLAHRRPWRQPLVIVPTQFRRLIGVVLGAATLLLPASLAAQGAAPDNAQISTYLPSAHELSRLTTSGSYLAARHAGTNRDAGAAAAYYRASLRGDPKNTELLERAFLSVLAEGDVEEAVRLADQVIKLDKNDRIARLVIGVHALKQKKYAVAKQNLTQSIRGPITDLAATLLAAWVSYGSGDAKTAIESIDKLQGADWYALFKDLHAGLILDLAGNKKEAGKRFDRAQKLDATALRLVESYGSWLSRNGKKDEALKVFKAFDAQLPRHPLIVDEMATLERDKQLQPLVGDAQAGAAEVLYGLGAALGRRLTSLGEEGRHPTEPSICSRIRRFISTAYSSGSSFVIGSTKPATIMAEASASERPRLMR